MFSLTIKNSYRSYVHLKLEEDEIELETPQSDWWDQPSVIPESKFNVIAILLKWHIFTNSYYKELGKSKMYTIY